MVRSSTSRLASDPRFEQRLAFVRSSEPSTVDPALLETMVKSVVSSLSGDISLVDLQLYREVQALADYIQTVRREIAGLRPSPQSRRTPRRRSRRPPHRRRNPATSARRATP